MAKLKPRNPLSDPTSGPLFTARFVSSLVLMLAGIAWIIYYYAAIRDGSPKALADLGLWNYAIGFCVFFLGLILAAHEDTPLGRGRGVVVGMLGCFLLGLLWICVFYVFSDDLSKLWVFNDLGQWNLVVGIAFMAVGFAYATKWE